MGSIADWPRSKSLDRWVPAFAGTSAFLVSLRSQEKLGG